MTEHSLIVIIEAAAALLFLASFVLSFKVFLRTRKTTDIWLLISFAAFMAFTASLLNSFEWQFSQSEGLDRAGEFVNIIFSVAWIYLSYRFMSFRSLSKG